MLQLAQNYGMDFFETSAFTNHNITEVRMKEFTARMSEDGVTPPLSVFQTFTRLAERVLAANKKDLDLLRMSLTDELNLAALEEEEGLCDGAAGDQHKQCWC